MRSIEAADVSEALDKQRDWGIQTYLAGSKRLI